MPGTNSMRLGSATEHINAPTHLAGNLAGSYAFGGLYPRSVDAEHPDDATEHINALEAFVGNLAEWLKAFASHMQLATEEP